MINNPIQQVYFRDSVPSNPVAGDSTYDPLDFSLSIYDGTQWNKVSYHDDLGKSIRKLNRIDKIHNIKKGYSNE